MFRVVLAFFLGFGDTCFFLQSIAGKIYSDCDFEFFLMLN